jgi:hypothetical protein
MFTETGDANQHTWTLPAAIMVEMSGGSVTGVEWVFVGVAQPDLTLSICA